MQLKNYVNTWSAVDNSQNQDEYLIYLEDLNSLNGINAYKQKTFDLLNIKKQQRLLDLGCGIGQDAISMVEHVGHSGKIIGLDSSMAMINEAKRSLLNKSLSVEFVFGHAEALPFCADYFDGCRADRVFQHIEKPELALLEMIRVAKSGAKIVISEPDWQTLVIDSGLKEETDIIVSTIANLMRNPNIGRQLLGMFKRSDLVNLSIETSTLIFTDFLLASLVCQLEAGVKLAENSGRLDQKSSRKWLNEQRFKSQSRQFFASLTGFAVSGTKV